MPGTADDDSSDDDIFSENAPLRSLPPAKASGAGPRRAEPSRATQRKASKRKRPERSTTPDSSPEPAAAAAAGRTALPPGSRRYRPSAAAPLAGAPAAAAAAAAAPRPASPDWSCYKCGCTQAAVCDTHSSVFDEQLLPSAALAHDERDTGPSHQELAKDKRRFVANRMKRCGHCRQRTAEFVRRDSKTPANAAGGALRLALRSASAPPTLRPAPPNSHGSLFYETSIDKKILRALARYAVVEKHHIDKGWAAYHASSLGMQSADHLWAVLRYVNKCILPKAQLGWCEDCTAVKYDSTNAAETILAATHCVSGQGREWKARWCCTHARELHHAVPHESLPRAPPPCGCSPHVPCGG